MINKRERQKLEERFKEKLTRTLDFINELINKPITQQIVLVISWVALIGAAAYLSVKSSNSNMSTGDQYDSAYPVVGWRPGYYVTFFAQHTNLLKIPYLWVQAKLFVFGSPSYVAMNVFLVVLTVVAWSCIVSRLVKQNAARSAANFALAGLLLGSFEFSTNLVMPTIRNIEYPLLLLYILTLQSYIRMPRRAKWLWAWIILALLAASDYYFLFVVPAAILASTALLYWRKFVTKRVAIEIGANVVIAAASGLAILKVGEVLGIIHLLQNPSAVVPYSEFWGQVQNSIQQTLQMFGGDFFGLPTRLIAATRLILAGVAVLSVVEAYLVLRYRATLTHLKQEGAFIYYCVALLFFMVIAAYILSGYAISGDGNIRYITALPFLGVLLLIVLFQHSSRLLLLASIVVFAAGIHALPLTNNAYAYRSQLSTSWITIDNNIITDLNQHNVTVGYGTLGYASTTWFFSKQKINIYNIRPCNIKNPVLSTSAWYADHHVSKSALIVDRSVGAVWTDESWVPCTQQVLQSIYGKPTSTQEVGKIANEPIEIMLYNYDIGTRLTN